MREKNGWIYSKILMIFHSNENIKWVYKKIETRRSSQSDII